MKFTYPFFLMKECTGDRLYRGTGGTHLLVYMTHKPYIHITYYCLNQSTLGCDVQRFLLLLFVVTTVTSHERHGASDHQQLRYNDVITWSLFQQYWPFVRGIWSPMDSPHNGPIMCFDVSFLLSWPSCWITIRVEFGLRRHGALMIFL